ncbi:MULTISPECIES: glycosyltransferase [Sphingomonas]|uniref:glycosyltransferase n=1 Tax=Sphingomonas TaxID=13687 RepID=UPI000DEF3E49|nr:MULTISPECIES: glycosyltransferase [Sphingomonas]
MAHFGLICPPFTAHLDSLAALGEELVRRGHRATFVLNTGAEVRGTSLPVVHVPARPGDPAVARILATAARPSGLAGTLRTIADSAALTSQLCAGGMSAIRELDLDAIVGDQLEPAAGLLARAARLPQVSVACALPIDHSPGVPLPYLDWPYDPSPRGRERARFAQKAGAVLSWRQRAALIRWSGKLGLRRTLRTPQDCLAPLQLAQVVRGYDFPRPDPAPFHAVGPLRSAQASEALPFTPDPSRPLVFATFGTLQGGRPELWRRLATAVHAAGAQLVIAHGGQLTAAEARATGADHVHAFLPYRAVLRHAALCIGHGGSNLVLDALACGVPLLIKPFDFDQPGNLARVLHHGLGERLVNKEIALQIRRLLADDRTRVRCHRLAQEIAAAGGTPRAADLVETVLP